MVGRRFETAFMTPTHSREVDITKTVSVQLVPRLELVDRFWGFPPQQHGEDARCQAPGTSMKGV